MGVSGSGLGSNTLAQIYIDMVSNAAGQNTIKYKQIYKYDHFQMDKFNTVQVQFGQIQLKYSLIKYIQIQICKVKYNYLMSNTMLNNHS